MTEELCGHSFSAPSFSAMNQRQDASLARFGAGRWLKPSLSDPRCAMLLS
jgi:hypothetical protein